MQAVYRACRPWTCCRHPRPAPAMPSSMLWLRFCDHYLSRHREARIWREFRPVRLRLRLGRCLGGSIRPLLHQPLDMPMSPKSALGETCRTDPRPHPRSETRVRYDSPESPERANDPAPQMISSLHDPQQADGQAGLLLLDGQLQVGEHGAAHLLRGVRGFGEAEYGGEQIFPKSCSKVVSKLARCQMHRLACMGARRLEDQFGGAASTSKSTACGR